MNNKYNAERIAFIVNAANNGNLKGGNRDVTSIYNLLTSHKFGQCSTESSIIIFDCKNRAMFENRFIDELLVNWKSDNQLVFYFTGHGITKRGKYCLKFGTAETDLIPFVNLQEYLSLYGVHKCIIILDACYSGNARIKNGDNIITESDIRDLPKGIALLTSSRSMQVSEEFPDGSGSVFTSLLCQGVEKGLNGVATVDGYISIEDIADYIRRNLEEDPSYKDFPQRPIFEINGADRQIWISKNPSGKFKRKEENLPSSAINDLDQLEFLYRNTVHTLHPCELATIDDLDWKLIDKYIQEADIDLSLINSRESILSEIGLFSPIMLHGKSLLHKSSVLCFSFRPEKFYACATSVFVKGNPRDKEFSRTEIFGSLSQQITKIVELTIQSLDTVSTINRSGIREDIYDVDIDLLRELISNAIVHRDYNLSSRTQVMVTSDAVEIISPGKFPEQTSWEMLINSRPFSNPVDPAIALYVARLRRFEGIGRGFDYIRHYIVKNGDKSIICEILPAPAISIRVLRRRNQYKTIENQITINNRNIFVDKLHYAAQQIESDRLLNLRLQGFVGRVAELADIREQIAMMRPTGGYVLIKAAAGEGKSSIIAKLIQEAGIAQTPHHFIALTTGREYQLGLLRAVVAQLILKHRLTVSYFPEESYPAMKGEFARILDELSKYGIEETIYLDGLDQLQPEIDGSRDLSFLPPQPPPGIVIVLGSRPDETLKPLEILHRVDYNLPPLSETDAFALWRSVQPAVADNLLHDLYTALKGNALFVHFASNILQEHPATNVDVVLRMIEQNPSNLFGIAMDRIKGRSMADWRAIWRPMLALLLVANKPLPIKLISEILATDYDSILDGLLVLGGLVSQNRDHFITLHHLMFRDYLSNTVFSTSEILKWREKFDNQGID